MNKPVAAVLMLGLTVAVFLPVHPAFRGQYGDEFPFSWYPMFSRPRPELEPVHYMIGLTAEGEKIILHSRYYVKGGMNQARRQIDRLSKKRSTALETCERAARRIRRETKFRDLIELRVVRGFYDMRKYFELRQRDPEREIIIARCSARRDDVGHPEGERL
jgi:hypothetical protein